ncbi:MAG TPA: hypothetical protein VLL76_04205 [Candidatus Omnitrophota bacterium]|nr:hypothetical protein [Candidatus Omnitrophota bacterium]
MWRVLSAGLFVCLLAPLAAKADQVTAVQAVRGQPKVIDALVDNGGNMFVSVKNDRTAWGQFATHLCNVVRPHQARIFRIQVVDVTTVAFGKPPSAWHKLAEARCGS